MTEEFEYSRRYKVSGLGPAACTVKLDANPAERAAIARLLGLVSLERFSAELTLRRWHKAGAAAEGMISADIIQECVVSLDPVPARIEEPVSVRFIPASDVKRSVQNLHDQEVFVDPDAEDPLEVFEGEEIDLGPVLLEFLATAIDPYPRAPGASLEQHGSTPQKDAAEEDEQKRENPFAALSGLFSGPKH